MNYQGVVSNISSFDYQDPRSGKVSKLYSFQLNGDKGTFYRTGSNVPKFEKGDHVNFEGNPGKGNSVTVDYKSVQSKKADTESTGTGVGNLAGRPVSTGVSKDDYWAAREARDVAVQKRIEIQSCRNSALQFIQILVSQEAVKFPAKGDKTEILENMLGHYVEKFLEANSGEKKEEEIPSAGTEDDLTGEYK